MAQLTPEFWQRLESVFHAALQIDPAQRSAYLDQACDPELRQQVESLILSSEETHQVMDAVIAEEAAAIAGVAPGERIGPYEILKELGHGGMGTVYLAIRADDHFRKQVAIKLMRVDSFNRSMVERFRTERQILANLEHPGIARLLDGGANALGSPYVVMEYVDGLPVDLYCERHRLSIRERLILFRRIAEAVSYAHRNLIVHRDIKPDNVLVTAEGEPKLLDFGIAKLLSPSRDLGNEPAQQAQMTVATERLMTPEFASPEQARGEAITTLSDVYSLGVLLYKMLTERVPVRVASQRAAEIEREICETLPIRASVAARQTNAWGAVWSKIGTDAARDLDTILTVALHKDAARRYASVENFSADIERYLNGFPVLARGDSWSYRTAKLIRRQPLATAAAALSLAVVVAFSIGMAILAQRARREARMANEVTGYLVGVFRSNDPNSGRGDLVTARELLDRGAQQIDSQLKDEPQVQARMLDTMGELYNDLGLSQKAEQLLRHSLEVRRARLSLTDEAAADTLDRLGDVAQDMSQFPAAENYFRQALAIHRKKTGESSGPVAEDYARISSVLWNMGDYSHAEELSRQAIALETALHGTDDLTALDMQNDLGTIFDSEGRYQQAVDQQKYVLDKRLRLEPPNHPDLGYSWHNYAQPLASLGHFQQAEDAERHAVAVRIAAYGNDHPQVAENQGELAGILLQTGKFDEALQLAQHAFERELELYGSDNRDTNYCRTNLAQALFAVGQTAQALDQAHTALSVWKRLVSPHHPKLASVLVILGKMDTAMGNLPAADKELADAIAYLTESYGAQHVLVADAQILRAETLIDEGKLTDAHTLASEALATERHTFPAGHPGVGLAESALGRIELAERHQAAALPLLQDAFQQVGKAYGPQHPQTASVGIRLAEALAANGKMQLASQLAQAQTPILRRSKDPQWHRELRLAEEEERGGSAQLLPRSSAIQ